ncbi:MAG: FecR domain-containing protein [Deltaproteobacteria bacterium]|nr:FecR domain-containing protein [Deltaproteobacteria bacterium]
MKTFAKGIACMAIAAAFLSFASNSRAESLGAMRVVLIQGDVQVKIADTGEWAPASINMPLLEGDELWVPEDGRAGLQTNNGTHIRFDRNTALQVLRMDRDSFQFYLPQGGVYVLNRASKRSVLQIDTPDASLRSFGGSTFRVDVPETETYLAVFRGSVLAENAEGRTNVRAGDMLTLTSDGYAELSPLPSPDEWQRWNEGQDRIVLARGEGYRYLPPELSVYSNDFDRNGRWVNVPGYGYCWTPTVLVVADWAPYRHGRWVWRGGDYVWIGYEPWGWAPYHYGRWVFTGGIGWCWVPPARGDVFWGPGYVGWVRTGDYVAWVPLAPREIYYGHGHFGRHSVNVTNVNINRIQVTNVYRNVNVTNSVTVIHQKTFVSGRPETVRKEIVGNVRDHFVQKRDIVIGRPPIKPERASYVPVARSIPDAKKPPASVRKIEVKEIRNKRPLVTEADRSAIRPEAKPRNLEVRKVEKPKPARERVHERKQVMPVTPRAPAERVTPKPPAGNAERDIERGKPREAPPERERVRPAEPQRKPPVRVEPEKRREPPEEKEQVRPGRPQGEPPVRMEQRRRPEPPPEKERVRPAEPQRRPPAEKEQVRPERPRGEPPDNVEQPQRGKNKDADRDEDRGGKKKPKGKEGREDSEKPPREPRERGERELR